MNFVKKLFTIIYEYTLFIKILLLNIHHQNFHLKLQLHHYELDVKEKKSKFSKYGYNCTISKLCRGLAISKKSEIYRLIRLVLTLLFSIATI